MSTKTTNYNLTKPAQTDYYNVDDFNNNFDIIDTELKANTNHTHTASSITGGVLPVSRGGTGQSAIDTAPTQGSAKMVTSGAVYSAVNAAGLANNVHRLRVTVDGNYSSAGSNALIINNTEKLSSVNKYETGDIVFVTFIMEETTITENSDYSISLKDDVFDGKLGAAAIYCIDNNGGVSNMTAGMLPKNKNAVFTIMCTLRKLSSTQVCLYVYN